jgi:hypothetical protein
VHPVSHIIAAQPAGLGETGTIFAILAAAVVILAGIAALVKAIWSTATTLRDNTAATRDLTNRLEEYTRASDVRFDKVHERLSAIEREVAAIRAGVQHGR